MCWALFCDVLVVVLSNLAIMLLRTRERERELTALLKCCVLFLMVSWVGLQCQIVAYLSLTRLPFDLDVT